MTFGLILRTEAVVVKVAFSHRLRLQVLLLSIFGLLSGLFVDITRERLLVIFMLLFYWHGGEKIRDYEGLESISF